MPRISLMARIHTALVNTLWSSGAAASDDTWRIKMNCAFPGPTTTRCCCFYYNFAKCGQISIILSNELRL